MRPMKKNIEFIVMNIDAPYNAILGRSWLGKIKAITSLYHKMLKFSSKEIIVVIQGK